MVAYKMLLRWKSSPAEHEPPNGSLAELRDACGSPSTEQAKPDGNIKTRKTALCESEDAISVVVKQANDQSSPNDSQSGCDISPAEYKNADDTDTFLSASPQTSPQYPNIAFQESVKFNDEEIPLKENADTFIITRQRYPSARNGALKNEMAAAMLTPTITAARAGEACKRKAEDLLAPRTLKRAYNNTASAVTDEISAYINGLAAGYDAPEIAGRVVQPIVDMGEKIPSRKEASKLVDKVTDRVQGWFGKRKKRRSITQDILDASNMKDMSDAHQVFAREMAAKARRLLVTEGICHRWQVVCDRSTMRWQCSLVSSLAAFYLEHRKYMQPEELMDAEPSWFADGGKSCFNLKLYVEWEVHGDPDVRHRNQFLTANFALPENFCKVSATDVYCDFASVSKGENGDAGANKRVIWVYGHGNEHSEDNGVV